MDNSLELDINPAKINSQHSKNSGHYKIKCWKTFESFKLGFLLFNFSYCILKQFNKKTIQFINLETFTDLNYFFKLQRHQVLSLLFKTTYQKLKEFDFDTNCKYFFRFQEPQL